MDRYLMNNDVLSKALPNEFNIVDGSLNDFMIDWQKVQVDKEYSVKLDKLHTARLNQKLLYYKMRNSMKEMIKLIDEEFKLMTPNYSKSIIRATKGFEYSSSKSVYNLIDNGLSGESIAKLTKLGFGKLVKKLLKVSSQ